MTFLEKRRSAIWIFGEIAKNPHHDFSLHACPRPRPCPPRRRRSGTTFRVSQFIRGEGARPFKILVGDFFLFLFNLFFIYQ